jgi:hypothetical protein
MRTLRPIIPIVLSLTAILLLAMFVFGAGEPSSPLGFERGNSSSFNASLFADVNTSAIAGNITFLTIEGITQTRAWQGFYGNVSGTITLDDAENYTFYNWTAAEPGGNIYATKTTHGTPSWLDVRCMVHASNASNFDTHYGITQDDYDNVSNTFNGTLGGTFSQTVFIVNNSFGTGAITDCPATAIWRDDNRQYEDFVNYLMWDSTGENDSFVFGTIIENKDDSNKTDISCYNGDICDFQILVAEDGHGTDTQVTPYYFWVDLQG